MKALLIIDMLDDFFQEGVLQERRDELVKQINRLLAWARRECWAIIWVRQEFRDDLEDAFLAMRKNDIRITIAGTPGAQILPELDKRASDYEIVKKRYSAFFRTRLDDLLTELGVSDLILVGVNSHACIRTAAIDAYQRDLNVVIPCECVASNDLEHHDVTLRYLSREIARVQPLKEVVQGIPE